MVAKGMRNAAIGFRAKTGRAIAVVIAGDAKSPAFVWRGEVTLVEPDARVGPYHEVMGLPWDKATVALQSVVSAIEAIAKAMLGEMIREMRSRDAEVAFVGVVGSPARNLEKIGNPHIRAHAAEGILFRRVLEVAAMRNHLECSAFSEEELNAQASPLLGTPDEVRSALGVMGRSAGAPWRADERLAATAAWMTLENCE
jgi:hypothetical protein